MFLGPSLRARCWCCLLVQHQPQLWLGKGVRQLRFIAKPKHGAHSEAFCRGEATGFFGQTFWHHDKMPRTLTGKV